MLACATLIPTYIHAQEPINLVEVQIDSEKIKEVGNTVVSIICNAHYEKPLAKIAIFIAGSVVASYGAYLIGASCKHALFPPQKPLIADNDTNKNYRKNCFMRGILGALIGSGLTYAGILAIIRSDRIFEYYHSA